MANNYQLSELKIEVNRKCPLKCLHCSSNGMPHAAQQLSSSKLVDLIREFAHMGGEKLCISGGEPLCYEALPTILRVSRRYGIETALYTVGISYDDGVLRPMSEQLLSLLAQYEVKVIFSLHGMSARTHDALTQVEGSFDTTLSVMERACEAKLATEVHIVPTAMNFKDISGMTRLLYSIGIKKISWLRFVPQGRGRLYRDMLQLSKDQLAQLPEIKVQLQQEYPDLKIRTGAPFNILWPECVSPCTAGLSVLVIRSDGRVLPCDAFKQFGVGDKFGDILNYSLSDVWTKSYFLSAIRRIQESRFSSSCASCTWYTRCESGCLAQTAIVAGRLTNGKDPDCLLHHVEVESGEIEAVAIH
jgi:radical SAM protein with 4Fe4S-binding SPASM domain